MGLESNSDVNDSPEVQETNENAADEAAERETQNQERGNELDNQEGMEKEDSPEEENSPEADTDEDEDPEASEGENPEDEGENLEDDGDNPEDDGEDPENEGGNPDETEEDTDDEDSRKNDLDEKNDLEGTDPDEAEEDGASDEDPEDKNEVPEDESEDPEAESEDPEDDGDNPEDDEDNPEDDGENPEDDEDNPEDDGENPEDDGENPEDDGDNPEDAGENPEDDGENPEDDGENPEDDGENPEDDGDNREDDGDNPEDDGEDPEDDGDNPEDDGENPEDDGDNPEDDGENPEEDGDNPEDDGENPEDDGDNPEDDGENPEDDGENPEDDGDNPEDDGENPENDGDNPEDDGDNPEDDGENPEDTEQNPENGDEDPEDAEETRRNDLDAQDVMSPALQEMHNYMSEHNYGYGDYPTYSQDPEWQRLNENLKNENAGVETERSDINGPGEGDDPDSSNDPESKIEGSRYRTVDADTVDLSGARGMDDPNFWNHHGNDKETYTEMAEKLPDIQKELGDGKSLDELRENPEYRDAIDAYYNPDTMVKVEQKPDGTYEFQDDGRHRVKAAQEAGVNIPVEVINPDEYPETVQLKDTSSNPEKAGTEISGENGESAEKKSEGFSVKEIENSDGSKKSMAELQERFDSLNEKYENTDASAKEGKEELGKLYGQNMGAIKDTHEKYNAEMSRKDELSREMNDLHVQYDSDFPPEVQKYYDGLVKEYRDCQSNAEQLKYQEAKLESNNMHIAEQLDKPYVPTSDMNSGQNRQQKMDGLQTSLNDLEAKIDSGKATPMDAYEFANTSQRMKDDIAHPSNLNEQFGVKDKESLGKMDAQVDRISDKLAEQFKDYKFHDDGTYTRTSDKSWEGYGRKSENREYTDQNGNKITEVSESSFASGRSKIEKTAITYTDRGQKLDASFRFDGFKTRTERTVEGADHSVSVSEKETRILGGDVKTSYDNNTKKSDLSADSNLASRRSGKLEESESGFKSSQTETSLGNLRVEAHKDTSSFNNAEWKGKIGANAADVEIHKTDQNPEGKRYSVDARRQFGVFEAGASANPSDLKIGKEFKVKPMEGNTKIQELGEEDKKKDE